MANLSKAGLGIKLALKKTNFGTYISKLEPGTKPPCMFIQVMKNF